MNVYEKALTDKDEAAKILLPLLEFEFCVTGEESPVLVQSVKNHDQLNQVFEICKAHGWTTFSSLRTKSNNPYFRMSKVGFKEIFELAGPFISSRRNRWAKLIFERMGHVGGYKGRMQSTETRMRGVLSRKKTRTVEDICLKLRLTPATVRATLRMLKNQGKVSSTRQGKVVTWRYS